MAAKKKTSSSEPTKYSAEEQKVIDGLMKLIRKEGRVRVRQAFRMLEKKFKSKNALRGFMKKLAEDGVLFELRDARDNTTYYYANRAGFYKPARLAKLIGEVEVDRIAAAVSNISQDSQQIAQQVYGSNGEQAAQFVETILELFLERELIKMDRQRAYTETDRGREFGTDTVSLQVADIAEVENLIAAEAEAEIPDPTQLTTDRIEKIVADDLFEKRISTVDITPMLRGRKSWKLLPIAEVLVGNQFSDLRLLNWLRTFARPDVTVFSGLVQGAYSAAQKSKQRVLTKKGGLNKVGHQLAVAGNILSDFEAITKEKVFYVAGDDDVAIAEDYALLAQKAEGKNWLYGCPRGTLSQEQAYRLYYREFDIKRTIQLEVIGPYQFRIGRGMKNKAEVQAAIGVRKSEYRLIIEILALKKYRKAWPKSYEKVVNMAALFGSTGKRFVTPDSLSLKVGNREILFVHNTNFSPITQYVDPIFAMESSIRQRLATGHSAPFMTIDCQQELFYGTYIGGAPGSGGHFMMTLPGMQNPLQEAEYRMRAPYRNALTSKSHRQNTFRKKLAIPGAAEWEFLDDGRIRMRIMNNKVRQILQDQRDEPEVREGICWLTDTQHGSITMVPELEALYMDYALYHRGAAYCIENGDIIHGTNYPQHFAESRPLRLTTMNSQKRFTEALQMPLLRGAPNLRVFMAQLGNHEWNSIGRKLSGDNDLDFLVTGLESFVAGQRAAGMKPTLQEIFNVSRIRVKRTHNPTEGDIVNWPYYAREIAGFKIAVSHLWMMWGGGRTPVDKQRKWLTGMSRVAGDIDFMFGGHWHSLWWCQEAEKLCFQVPSTASQSGYELILGLMSTAMCTYLEFSNRDGVTIELVPWEFLFNHYKPQSPFLKGRQQDLKRPKPGTVEYRQGKCSPFIEEMIDNLTGYIEV
jgi:hypothetical protein